MHRGATPICDFFSSLDVDVESRKRFFALMLAFDDGRGIRAKWASPFSSGKRRVRPVRDGRRAPAFVFSRPFSNQTTAMNSFERVLNDLLPLLDSRRLELHEHATLLEVNDPAQLVELATTPKLRRFLLARLSNTIALVDPGRADDLVKALRAEGHTPKINKS
jgi:hypothetical protein